MMFTIKQEAVGDKQAPKWKQKENIKVTKSFQGYIRTISLYSKTYTIWRNGRTPGG